MTEDQMAWVLDLMRRGGSQLAVTGEGVVFTSERHARISSDQHDKDLVQIGAGWLARNRDVHPSPMPTQQGDVVVLHRHQVFRIWTVTDDGSQEPDANVAPLDVWGRAEAEAAARGMAATTGGRIFWLQDDGDWARIPASGESA